MQMFKRIFLFLAVNFFVVITLSIILSLFNIRPYLTAYGLDYTSLLIFCLIWGMGGALISLALSKIMAKWLMGVRIIPENPHSPQQQMLLKMIRRLAQEAKLKAVPEVGIFSSAAPNAFATGPTQNHSLVAVSTGLMEKMSPEELEAVLAHEISHIANGDMVTMTLLQGIVNAFVMFLARILAYVFSGFGRSNDNRGGSIMSYYLFTLLFEVVFMILGSLVVAAFSRYREFRADFGGARLTGKEKMIAALDKLRLSTRQKEELEGKKSFQALMISTPTKFGIMRLFATHPPLDERIARLKKM
ncbi:MAG: protease HtpX [Simkaniaceae bacterium]